MQAEAAAVERGLEVRQHHRHGRVRLCAGQRGHAGNHRRLDLAQAVAGGIEPQHREEGVVRRRDGIVEIGVAVRVVHVRVAEQDVEHHCLGLLLLDLLDELAQHLARPRPAPVVPGHRREAGLVDVHDHDVGIGLRHHEAIAHHRVERRLAHLGGVVQHHGVEHREHAEQPGEIEIEAVLPPPREPLGNIHARFEQAADEEFPGHGGFLRVRGVIL